MALFTGINKSGAFLKKVQRFQLRKSLRHDFLRFCLRFLRGLCVFCVFCMRCPKFSVCFLCVISVCVCVCARAHMCVIVSVCVHVCDACTCTCLIARVRGMFSTLIQRRCALVQSGTHMCRSMERTDSVRSHPI